MATIGYDTGAIYGGRDLSSRVRVYNKAPSLPLVLVLIRPLVELARSTQPGDYDSIQLVSSSRQPIDL